MIGHTNRQTEITTLYALAWEPGAAQITNSYFRRLPALRRFYQETKFLL